jgi:Domain of unknown function (DUF3854)
VNPEYHTTSASALQNLRADHRRQLEEGSAIAREVLEERGYRTTSRAEVPPEFKGYQRRAGMLIPLYSPDGTTTGYQLRADNPRRDKRDKPIRYETPAGARIIADVHPMMREAVADASTPLWITEGTKKGDALASRGRCAVSLVGVWMFRPKGSPDMLPCFDHVALQGRRVYLVFDSDVMRKPEVGQALERLVGDLEHRDARVLVVYLPDAPDGGKMGVDDYLATVPGASVEYLEEIARPFTPSDATRERMSRNGHLQSGVAELWQIWSAHGWHGTGGHTRREIARALIEDAERGGEPVEGGIRVTAAQRRLAERAGTRQPTVSAALRTLEHQDGLLRRDTRKRAEDAPAAYILLTPEREGRAYPYQKGKTGRGRDEKHQQGKAGICRKYDPGDTPTRALEEIKHLRWSYVARVWAGDGYAYEYHERLGKIGGRVLESLVALGGVATLPELADALGRKRARDLARDDRKLRARPVKTLADRTVIEFERVGRVGIVTRLADAGLARVEGDTVILADDWPEKLGLARELGGEYEAEEAARTRHRAARNAYREYLKKGETLSAEEHARLRREKARTRREAREARRQRARDRDRELRPNYWNWRKRDHLSRAGADGFLRELAPASEPEPPEPARKLPPMVDGIYEHGALCDCAWCGDSPEPRYASPAKVGTV